MNADGFDSSLDTRARQVLALLERVRFPPRSPEYRKSLERLHAAIMDARRLGREGELDNGERALLLGLLDRDPLESADALGQVLETIDQTLAFAGDDRLVLSLLEIEYARDRLERGGDIPTWSHLFCDKKAGASQTFYAGQTVTEEELVEARKQLSLLLRTRQSTYGRIRARTMTKAHTLLWLTPVLTALVAALVVLAGVVGGDGTWREALLVAVAGAVGASLAAVFRLRDRIPRLGDLRPFWYTFPLQLPLGAIAGLFLWLMLESGLVEVGDDGWAIAAAVAFAAGFSEPFLLKTVERIVGGVRGEEPS